jgi:hypothetical protein
MVCLLPGCAKYATVARVSTPAVSPISESAEGYKFERVGLATAGWFGNLRNASLAGGGQNREMAVLQNHELVASGFLWLDLVGFGRINPEAWRQGVKQEARRQKAKKQTGGKLLWVRFAPQESRKNG